MHDAEGVFYFSAHADKKAVLDFCIMHGKENRKMCFPGIASLKPKVPIAQAQPYGEMWT